MAMQVALPEFISQAILLKVLKNEFSRCDRVQFVLCPALNVAGSCFALWMTLLVLQSYLQRHLRRLAFRLACQLSESACYLMVPVSLN